MNIAVTGTSGFLGRTFINKLMIDTSMNDSILILDRNPDRLKFNNVHQKNIDITNSKVLSIKYDLANDINNYISDYNIKEKLDSIECLIHLAAFVPRSGNIKDDKLEESIDVNIRGTYNLIELFKNLKHIVFASTVDVYGIPESLPIYEIDSTNPISYYGASKLACEKYLSIYGKRNDINVTILRFSTIYGPGELYNKAIPNFIKNVINDKPPVIYGDGHEVRDCIYIDDASNAITCAIQKRTTTTCCHANGVYNIASGSPYTIKEIAEMIIKISGKDLKIIYEPRSKPYVYFDFDIESAKKDLDFHPDTDMIDGITEEYKWYENLNKVN